MKKSEVEKLLLRILNDNSPVQIGPEQLTEPFWDLGLDSLSTEIALATILEELNISVESVSAKIALISTPTELAEIVSQEVVRAT